MNKKLKITILLSLVILIIAILILGRTALKSKSHEKDEPKVIYENTLRLKKIIKDSHYFKNATLTTKKEGEVNSVTIDKKYKIIVNDGFYAIDIDDTTDESYCNIVDAIEVNLGHKKGDAIDTCNKILKSSIMSQSGISLDINNGKKMLIVDSDTKYELYSPHKIYNKFDLIRVEEENHGIKIDNYELLSITVSNYIDEYKNFQVCMNASGDISSKQYKVTLYDANKQEVNTASLKSTSEEGMPNRYCANFSHDSNDVAYYSIGNK